MKTVAREQPIIDVKALEACTTVERKDVKLSSRRSSPKEYSIFFCLQLEL